MCTICNIEKDINTFYRNYSESVDCNRTKRLKRYYENKDKISNQQKIYYENNREKNYYRNKTIEVNKLET